MPLCKPFGAEAFFLCILMSPLFDPNSHKVYRRSICGITGSNSAERMIDRLVCLLRVVYVAASATG